MNNDIIIVGCGVAGLYCALNLPKEKNIIIVTKNEAPKSDSFLAQGGICVLRDEKEYKSFYDDTMKAGHYENNPDSVDIMIRSSQEVIGIWSPSVCVLRKTAMNSRIPARAPIPDPVFSSTRTKRAKKLLRICWKRQEAAATLL